MPASLRVAVVGAAGRMGSAACRWIGAAPDLELAAAIGRSDALEPSLRGAGAAVALDLTVAGRGFEHGLAMLAAGVRPVIGTSGVDAEQTAALDREARARSLGGLVVPNFSLGMALLQRAAELAAPHLPEIAIVERHHRGKRDRPSGTAIEAAERLSRARGAASEEGGGDVPIHSLRFTGASALHRVVLARAGERLELAHEVTDVEAYRAGVLFALRRAAVATGIARGLVDLLDELA